MTKLIANIFVTKLNINISVNTFVTNLKYQVRGSSSDSCSQSGAFLTRPALGGMLYTSRERIEGFDLARRDMAAAIAEKPCKKTRFAIANM